MKSITAEKGQNESQIYRDQQRVSRVTGSRGKSSKCLGSDVAQLLVVQRFSRPLMGREKNCREFKEILEEPRRLWKVT